MIRAAIFDLDGTITEPLLDFDEIRRQMGLARDAGPILEAMKGMTDEQRRSAEDILRTHEDRAVVESTLNPGARLTLEALRARGIAVGILTRNTRANALAVATKHALEFDGVVDRSDGPIKPDSFGVRRLCESFGVSPDEAMVVGDYFFDLLSAHAAGAGAALLLHPGVNEQYAAFADYPLARLDDLVRIIDNINRK